MPGAHYESQILRSCKSDAENCNTRLTSVLKAFGFALLSMPGDGDWFFHCASKSLMSTTKAQVRNWLSFEVNWVQQRDAWKQEGHHSALDVYEPLLVTSTGSYDKEAQNFQQPGFQNSELDNCVPLVTSNILQVPVVIFTYTDNYPITHIIPRGGVLSEVPSYLAYDNSSSEHYRSLDEETAADSSTVGIEPSFH